MEVSSKKMLCNLFDTHYDSFEQKYEEQFEGINFMGLLLHIIGEDKNLILKNKTYLLSFYF